MANINSRSKIPVSSTATPARIGIARCFTHFLDVFDWAPFFADLGCTVVQTRESDRSQFERGFTLAASDQCLPVKLFYGHVAELVGKADFTFIPQLVSLWPRTYCCPAVIGLPLMMAHTFPAMPPLLSASIEFSAPWRTHYRVLKLALQLSRDPKRVWRAMRRFRTAFRAHTYRVAQPEVWPKPSAGRPRIGVIGKRYSLRDRFLNMGLMERIRAYGYDIITLDDVEGGLDFPRLGIDRHFDCRPVHWDYGQRVIATVDRFLATEAIAGVIFLTFFGCGIDAFIEDVFKERVIREKPYLSLTVDEHTGEAGIVTRIEAFLDMLGRSRSSS